MANDMAVVLNENPVISEGDVETAVVDFTEWLRTEDSEVLTSALMVELDGNELSISSVVVNSVEIDGIPPGQAITAVITGQLASTGRYTLRTTGSTNEGRKAERDHKFTVAAQ